jgi:hypothetical protein
MTALVTAPALPNRWLVLALVGLLGPGAAEAAASAPTRSDDAYHLAQFAGGPHDANYVEWWYFNVEDPAQGLQLAVTYAVLDPLNVSGFGLSSVAAIAYTPGGHFTETAVYPTTAFHASPAQADVLIADGSSAAWNYTQVLSDEVYRVVGSIHQGHDVSWNLFYVRRDSAWLGADREHVGLFPWEEMSWLQYMPAAFVTGEVVVDGRPYHMTNTPGYHDHNWGEWIPFTVTWNWAQFIGPGLTFSMGDFRNSAAGVVSVDSFGQRTIFEKDQYRLIHDKWSYDPVNQLWFPTSTWLYAQDDDRTLVVWLGAIETVPVRPPPQVPLPLVPVIYEQTADYVGWVWDKDAAGGWQLARSFRGQGFKEYTGVTAVPAP